MTLFWRKATSSVVTDSIPPWHALAHSEVVTELNTAISGLSEIESQQRLHSHGPNKLPEVARPSWLYRFLQQCHNVLIYVLLLSAVVTLSLAHWVDSGVIIGVVVINALIGLIQEGKAEQAILALRTMLSTQATVLHDGKRSIIDAEGLVPGDIVFIQAGDKVPADLRLLQVKNLQVQEAALTGESQPVVKQTAAVSEQTLMPDRYCMAYSGTLVTFGQAVGVVVATGAGTELGRISMMLSQLPTITTPLLRQMAQFARQLSVIIVLIAILTLLAGVWLHGMALADMFIAAVSVAVAAIPEGLPAIMTITLAIGVQKMAARRAIIRRLPAVETLGSVTTICTDKTGTLTCNQMTATKLWVSGAGPFEITGSGYDPHGGFFQQGQPVDFSDCSLPMAFIRAGLLCNDAELYQQQEKWQIQGDPTEAALVVLAMKAGLTEHFEHEALPRVDVIPFESEHQFMATLHHDHTGHNYCYIKGAPERVLSMCQYQREAHGDENLDKAFWHQQLDTMAAEGLRVLAIACKTDLAEQTLTFDDVSHGLLLLGLVGMIDPPRPDAIAAVNSCQHAGIKVKMITGDHSVTATAIARQIGIVNPEKVLNGQQLEKMTDEELQRSVSEVSIFARATPEHKLRLVTALQANGEVVAMTGDGVNDAPALKRADVGTAMGQNGTEVAKDAAEMVLADDNFASIVDAIEQGRTVYDNLTKAILFTLPTSAGEALIVIAAILLGESLPITPVQILWVNMITAVTLALALAFEPGEQQVMLKAPRDPKQPLLTGTLLWRVLFVSLIMMLGSFGLFQWQMLHGSSIDYARTVAVNTLVMFEIFYLFNSRYLSGSVLNWRGLTGNRYVLLAVALLLIFQLAFTYTKPMQLLFSSTSIDWHSWLGIVLVASVVLWLVEIEKKLLNSKNKKKPG